MFINLTILLLSILNAGFYHEPDIQCTVIKVHKTVDLFGFRNFPTKFDSINNIGLLSKLSIKEKEFPHLSVKTTYHARRIEKVLIKEGAVEVMITLRGEPMSRKGFLTVDGEKIAELTCH
jgi:hypothetical protein